MGTPIFLHILSSFFFVSIFLYIRGWLLKMKKRKNKDKEVKERKEEKGRKRKKKEKEKEKEKEKKGRKKKKKKLNNYFKHIHKIKHFSSLIHNKYYNVIIPILIFIFLSSFH